MIDNNKKIGKLIKKYNKEYEILNLTTIIFLIGAFILVGCSFLTNNLNEKIILNLLILGILIMTLIPEIQKINEINKLSINIYLLKNQKNNGVKK